MTGVSGIGQEFARQRHPLGGAQPRRQQGGIGQPGHAHEDHRPRAHRQGDRHRPVADRPHAALEPGDLRQTVRRDPRPVHATAAVEDARLQAGRFSFNVAGGRCEACEGHGATKLEMDFLADIWVPCPVCEGQRFNHETLEVKYKEQEHRRRPRHGRAGGARALREPSRRSSSMLQTLHDVGLDYIKLGQPSPTLSGGEAQRIKLARELGKRSTGKTVYLLDEPTTGLHFADVRKLLRSAARIRRCRQHGDRRRTQPRRDQDGRLGHRPRPGRGPRRRHDRRRAERRKRSRRATASHTGRALRTVLESSTVESQRSEEEVESQRATPSLNALDDSDCDDIDDRHHHPRRRPAQPAAPRPHDPARQDERLLRAERQRQEFAGDGHALRRRAAAVRRVAVGLRPAVPRPDAQAEGRAHLTACRRRSPSSRRPSATRRARPSAPSPKSTTTCASSTPGSDSRTARTAAVPVTRQTTDEIVDRILSLPGGDAARTSPPRSKSPSARATTKLWDDLGTQGFLRVRINGTTHVHRRGPGDRPQTRAHRRSGHRPHEGRTPKRAAASPTRSRAALDLGKGVVHVIRSRKRRRRKSSGAIDRLSLHYSCPKCARST